jgi:hypothetical protein
MEYVHAHPPEALIEGREHEHAGSAHDDRWLELGAVLLMAIATLATAWCGFQAATWSGHLSEDFSSAASSRVLAMQASTEAGQHRIDDLIYFDSWLEARQAGNEQLADLHRRRFRPDFVPAFEAWMAQRPFTNPSAIAGPLYMPEYRSTAAALGVAHDEVAEEHFTHGIQAKSNADRYILATVFMAAVLFFAGISLRLDWLRLRITVLGMAGALLAGGAAFVLSLPLA